MPDTIDHLVRLQSADHGAKPMVIDPVSRVSYRELDTTTCELAAALVDAEVGKGTRVGLIMPNNTRWVQIALALTRIGAVLVPLSTLLRAGELVAQLRAASVQFLVSVEEFRGHRYLDGLRSRQSELPALRQLWTADMISNAVASQGARRVVGAMTDTVTPADPLVIMFTSGSSGPPKGVVHSHGSALGAVRSGLAARCITSDTRLYLPMPFFWVGGFGSGILSDTAGGRNVGDRGNSAARNHLAPAGRASGSRYSGAGPTKPRPWPGTRAERALISRRYAPAVSRPYLRPNSALNPGRGPSCSA